MTRYAASWRRDFPSARVPVYRANARQARGEVNAHIHAVTGMGVFRNVRRGRDGLYPEREPCCNAPALTRLRHAAFVPQLFELTDLCCYFGLCLRAHVSTVRLSIVLDSDGHTAVPPFGVLVDARPAVRVPPHCALPSHLRCRVFGLTARSERGHEIVQAIGRDATKSADGNGLDYPSGYEAVHRSTPNPQTLGSFLDGQKHGLARSRWWTHLNLPPWLLTWLITSRSA